jgi:hypothetical protein
MARLFEKRARVCTVGLHFAQGAVESCLQNASGRDFTWSWVGQVSRSAFDVVAHFLGNSGLIVTGQTAFRSRLHEEVVEISKRL